MRALKFIALGGVIFARDASKQIFTDASAGGNIE